MTSFFCTPGLPVPKLMSTKSSKTMGILRSQKGWRTIFPFRCWYLASAGWTATAVSPSIVSIRVVATITSSSEGQRKNKETCIVTAAQSVFVNIFLLSINLHTRSIHLVGKRHQDPKLDFLLVTRHRQKSPASELLFIHLKAEKYI